MRIISALLLLLLQLPVFSESKLPGGAYWGVQLDRAMNSAAKAKKPLILVYGPAIQFEKPDPEVLETLKAAGQLGLPVVISNLTSMPPPALTAVFAEVQKGGFRGATVICSPEGDKVWKVFLTAASPADQKKITEAAIGEVKKPIAEWFNARPPHGPQLPDDTPLYWGLLGKNDPAAGVFGKVTSKGIYFKDTDPTGPPDILLADLNQAGLRYANFISAQGENAPAAAKMEKWTNAQGKALEASFVSLKDDTLTLRTAAGKNVTLLLKTLAEESQKRAAELADAAK